MAYRSYWKSALISVLRRYHVEGRQQASIKELSVETAIHSNDIIATMLEAEMLAINTDSTFSIVMDKVLNANLDSLRRRTIREELLYWEPEFDVEPLNKMGSYASD